MRLMPVTLRLLPLFVLLASVTLGCGPMRGAQSEEPGAARILSHDVLTQDSASYLAWPAVAEASNGDLIVAFTRTEEHVSPDGQIVLIRSKDRGLSWSEPVVVFDSVIDDRESGLTALPDGRLMMHVWSTHWSRSDYSTTYADSYPQPYLDRWSDRVSEPDYAAAEHLQGGWVVVSEDDGYTWSAPRPGPDTIHGGIALRDGSLLVASYRQNDGAVGIYAAPTPEGPWEQTATVSSPEPDIIRFAEPHVLRLPSGRILMTIRATARPYNDRHDRLFVWQTYSDDDGRIWQTPIETPYWGVPPHLAGLRDGRVLLTYGHRRPPFGQRAALSEDGVNWDPTSEIVLRDDAPSGDLGYPVSIEVAPDTILTIYYQEVPPGDVRDPGAIDTARLRTDILATRWIVPGR